MIRPGPRNLITDVAGLAVGHADDARLRSGVTAIVGEAPVRAGVDVRGGGPGTRETDVMAHGATVAAIDALVLAGGSAFGLGAADGVLAWLKAKGRGFAVGPVRVPIVPAAILFDLLNGGDKDWGTVSPYPALGEKAAAAAASDFALGSHGAGLGATTARLKGGIGSASALYGDDTTVGALVAVNAAGDVTLGESGHFWAAPFEIGAEFGGRGLPSPLPADAAVPRLKGGARQNTTLAVVATDADLDANQLKRLAVMAQDGLARAIYPVHTPLDGDIVFALSTGRKPLSDPVADLARIGTLAANTLSRAVARGIHEATAFADGGPPAWQDVFGGTSG